jgi:20S proteasome alpha/beta subunit
MASALAPATALCLFDRAVCCGCCGGAAHTRALVGELDMEIELWRCEYEVKCSAHGCTVMAVTLLRHLYEQGRFIRQRELCE